MNQEYRNTKGIRKEQEENAAAAKPKRRIIRGFFKSMINVRSWSSFDEIKATGKVISRSAKVLFTRRKPQHFETFEQAMQRLHLSDEDLSRRKKQFLQSSLIYALIALALFVYGFYLLFGAHHFAAFACLSLAAMISTYAIREHFWYMQITKRKLGCTLKEWTNFVAEVLFWRKK